VWQPATLNSLQRVASTATDDSAGSAAAPSVVHKPSGDAFVSGGSAAAEPAAVQRTPSTSSIGSSGSLSFSTIAKIKKGTGKWKEMSVEQKNEGFWEKVRRLGVQAARKEQKGTIDTMQTQVMSQIEQLEERLIQRQVRAPSHTHCDRLLLLTCWILHNQHRHNTHWHRNLAVYLLPSLLCYQLLSLRSNHILHKPHPAQTSSCTNLILHKPHPAQTASCTNLSLHKPHPAQTSSCTNLILHKPHPAQTASCTNLSLHKPHPVQTSSCTNLILHKPQPAQTSACTGMRVVLR